MRHAIKNKTSVVLCRVALLACGVNGVRWLGQSISTRVYTTTKV